MLSTLRRVEGYHTQVYDGNICRDEDSSVLRPTLFHWRYLLFPSVKTQCWDVFTP